MQDMGLLDGEVVVEEKIDGSNFRIQIQGDKIKIGSRRVDDLAEITREELIVLKDEKMFKKGFNIVFEMREKLFNLLNIYQQDKILLFCEYLQDKKHNALCYERIPKNYLVLFDVVFEKNGELRHIYKLNDKILKHEIADYLGIEKINIMYEGEFKKDLFSKFLKEKSQLGKEIVEGIVIKNYNRHYPVDLISTKAYKDFALVGKWVREEFKEVLAREWRGKKAKGNDYEELINSLLTQARLNKAIMRLKEEGKINNEKRDLAVLIPEFVNDVVDEEKENIKGVLWKLFFEEFKRKAQRFVVKEYLKKLEESI